jgi:hypothetical protein
MFCVYTLRQHPLYTLASLVAYTLLQPLRIPKGARPSSKLGEAKVAGKFKSILIGTKFLVGTDLTLAMGLKNLVFYGKNEHGHTIVK